MKVAVTVLALIAVALLSYGGLTLWKQQQVAGSDAAANAMQQLADDRAMVEVTFVVTAPPSTPDDQDVYISGSHPAIGSWEAAGLPLEKHADGTYRGTCQMLSGIEQEFKVTRGSWSTVERTADDEEVENRAFTVEPDAELAIAVEEWVDHGQTIPGRNTALPGVRLHERRFFSTVDPTKPRSLAVYLPPNYGQDESVRYPVLYIHDGQNIFNEATSFAGTEWGLDETAQQLIEAGQIEPVIIVGVYNTEDREVEYNQGVAAYADHFADTLKPFIDETYLTLPDREHTTLAGAALGGRAAIEVARLKPDVFGTVVALSPFVIDEAGSNILDAWNSNDQPTKAWAKQTRFRLDTANTTEHYATDTPAEDLQALADWLNAAGANIEHKTIEDGEHREPSWGQRAADFLRNLYPKSADEPAAESVSDATPRDLQQDREPHMLLQNTAFYGLFEPDPLDWRQWMKDPHLALRSHNDLRMRQLFGC